MSLLVSPLVPGPGALHPDITEATRNLSELLVPIGSVRCIADNHPELALDRVDEGDSWNLYAAMTEQTINEIVDYSVSQNLTTLRNRVNELGVSEPLVQRQGRNRIVVELPGIQDTAEAKRILGKVANLEFRLVKWHHLIDYFLPSSFSFSF